MSSSPSHPPVRRRRSPSWRQWVLALGGAALFVVALILFVNAENRTANQPAGTSSPAAAAEQNREDAIVVKADQAPHVVALPARAAPGRALRQAVVAYMKRQVAAGSIGGPVMGSRCSPASGGSRTRLAFRCHVVAANVTYPFLGVVDTSSRQVTYCKRDYPPVPSMNIPVSRRCT